MPAPFKPGDKVVYHRGHFGVAVVVSSGNVHSDVRWSDGMVETIWNDRLALAPPEEPTPEGQV